MSDRITVKFPHCVMMIEKLPNRDKSEDKHTVWKIIDFTHIAFENRFHEIFCKGICCSDAIKVRSLKVQCSLNGFWKNMYQQSLEKNAKFTFYSTLPFLQNLLALKQVICTSIVHSTIWKILLQCCQLILEKIGTYFHKFYPVPRPTNRLSL